MKLNPALVGGMRKHQKLAMPNNHKLSIADAHKHPRVLDERLVRTTSMADYCNCRSCSRAEEPARGACACQFAKMAGRGPWKVNQLLFSRAGLLTAADDRGFLNGHI